MGGGDPMGFGLLIHAVPAGTNHGQVDEVYKVVFQGIRSNY